MTKIILQDEDGDTYSFSNIGELLESVCPALGLKYYDKFAGDFI